MPHIDDIVLRVIGHVGALRQFVGDGEAAGGVVHQGFQQKPLVTGHGGGGPLVGPGLRNIKDLFHIVGHARASVVLSVLLARFQDGDGVLEPLDVHAVGLPGVEVGQLGGLRALGGDQDGVAHGVEVKPGLHIQIGPEHTAVHPHVVNIVVDHGVDALALRLLFRRPCVLVKRRLLLRGGLLGKQIIIIRHRYRSFNRLGLYFRGALCFGPLVGLDCSLPFAAFSLCSALMSFNSCRTERRERSCGSEVPGAVRSLGFEVGSD